MRSRRMTLPANCASSLLFVSYEPFVDATSKPNTSADIVPIRPTPSFIRSFVSGSRWCFGMIARSPIPAKPPADKQQKIVTATPIEVMSLPHCVKLQLRQTARVAYPALQNRSGINDHSQTPSQTTGGQPDCRNPGGAQARAVVYGGVEIVNP